jgi:hypothetical protein
MLLLKKFPCSGWRRLTISFAPSCQFTKKKTNFANPPEVIHENSIGNSPGPRLSPSNGVAPFRLDVKEVKRPHHTFNYFVCQVLAKPSRSRNTYSRDAVMRRREGNRRKSDPLCSPMPIPMDVGAFVLARLSHQLVHHISSLSVENQYCLNGDSRSERKFCKRRFELFTPANYGALFE